MRHLLGYRDSGMPGSPDNHHPQALAAAPLREVALATVRILRRVRPQVVITFDPIGGYRHPDHIAVHQATVEAFRLAADPACLPGEGDPYAPQKLYFHTFPRGFLRWGARILRWIGQDPAHFGKHKEIDSASLADVDFPTHAKIDIRPVLSVKQRAAACHTSQGGGPAGGFMTVFGALVGGTEAYMQAYPLPPPARIEDDLFGNVDESR
jgi:LmbE family N-acetylglucosaminyl deacetylase